MCIGEHIGRDGALAQEIEQNPAEMIGKLKAEIAAYQPDPREANGLAHRYAMLADAAYVGDEMTLASESVERGLESLHDRSDRALVDRLMLMRAMLLDGNGQPGPALERYEAYARTIPTSAPYYFCVLYERGHLRRRNGRFSTAIEDLLEAYDIAQRAGRADDRALVAESLALTYSRVEFFDDAARYADESVAHYETDPRRGLLAHALLFRGDIDKSRGDYDRAIADLQRVRALAREVKSKFYELFADAVLCEVFTKQGRLAEARGACDAGAELSAHLEDPEGAQAVNLTRAELYVAMQRPEDALTTLEKIPRSSESHMPKSYLRRMHDVRARALAAVGRGAEAYAEARVYIDQQMEDSRSSGAEKIAAVRTQIETSYKDRQLQLADRERALLLEQLAQSRRNYVLLGLAILITIGIALFVVGIRRKQRDADRARREAEQRLAAVAKLTGGIAHDFNNLMTVVQQTAGLLARSPALEGHPDALSLVDETQMAAATGGAITRQLLAFSRQLHLRPELIDLGDFIQATGPVLERTAGASVRLLIESPVRGLAVWADRAQLTTALLNVVANSRDATAAAGTIAIRCRAATGREAAAWGLPDGATVITIADDGCGMSGEVLERVREPFFTTKDVTSGSGLGLSVVDGFATQSGGRLNISSQPGLGTTIELVLAARDPHVSHGNG